MVCSLSRDVLLSVYSLTSDLGHVLVGTDTSGFESFGRQLFILIGHQVDTLRELIHTRLLLTEVEDSDLGVWDTTTETGLRVGFVLAVTVTSGWSSPHVVVWLLKAEV